MPNLAALRGAIFLLSAKNRWGAHMCPPPAVRGLNAGRGIKLRTEEGFATPRGAEEVSVALAKNVSPD